MTRGWKREGILTLKEEYKKGKVCSGSAFMLVTEQSGITEETNTKFKGKHENKERDLQLTAQNKQH